MKDYGVSLFRNLSHADPPVFTRRSSIEMGMAGTGHSPALNENGFRFTARFH